MSIITRHKQALADLEYIERHFGAINDKDDYIKSEVDRLLATPSRSVAFEIIYSQLVTLFEKGYLAKTRTLGGVVIKPLPIDDPNVEEIQLRWDLPEPPKQK